MHRLFLLLLAGLALFTDVGARAQQNGFDLAGPDLAISVTRNGVTLPITAVPSLQGGDRLTAKAVFPTEQSARYLLIVAFLRGATNPPPKDWFFEVETWHRKKNVLDVVVPNDAQEAILFLAPEAGGGFGAVREAVRGRPGVFVRAAQDLHQASLDRARLDAFVAAIARFEQTAPERLATAAPVLAEALRIKFNADCLLRQRALQPACLTQNRDALVLQAQSGATWTETLTGAPVDLAYRVAATPEGGAGYYSPYIALARDLARLFGAFRTAQYQYFPALALGSGDGIRLQLNAAPSFQNPRSVLVAPLPPIGPTPLPVWRAGGAASVCLARPDIVLPLEDASLLFATGYARDLKLRLGTEGAAVELPVVVDAESGGVRLAPGTRLPTTGPVQEAILHGRWGFDAFSGPRLPVQLDLAGAWAAQPDNVVVVGRDHPLVLHGGASACVEQVALRDAGGESRLLQWKPQGPSGLEVQLPLAKVRPGPLTLTVARYGTAAPAPVALVGRTEASRLDRFTVHAGDRTGVLEGARLDQVGQVEVAGHSFAAGALTRGPQGDRLEMTSAQVVEPEKAGLTAQGAVRLRDGRSTTVPATVAEPRPVATLLNRQVMFQPPPNGLPLTLPEGIVPADGTLTFSLRVPGRPLANGDLIEVAAEGGTSARLTVASGALQRVAGDVVVTKLSPAALLGPAVSGPLRYRPWRGEVAGDWQPLVRIVRLPILTSIDCAGETATCTLSGQNLFVIAALGDKPDLTGGTVLPPGFVAPSVTLPRPSTRALFLRLHDAPEAVLRVELPTSG